MLKSFSANVSYRTASGYSSKTAYRCRPGDDEVGATLISTAEDLARIAKVGGVGREMMLAVQRIVGDAS